MAFLVNDLLPYVLAYKYIAIFLICYFGAILLPLPSGSIIMASCAFAAQGYMNVYAVIAVGILGNVAGDQSGYWIARLYGIPVLQKIGFRKKLESPAFTGVHSGLEAHPILTIFFSRFLTAIAPTVNIVAGLARMSFQRYTFYEVAGEIAEVTFYGTIGYLVGTNWEHVSSMMGKFWIVIVISLLLCVYLWKKIIKHGSQKLTRP